jgi:hypothetical protein
MNRASSILESRLLAVYSPQRVLLFPGSKEAISRVRVCTMSTAISAASVIRFIVFFGVSAVYFMFYA